jgi:hypothetical protein
VPPGCERTDRQRVLRADIAHDDGLDDDCDDGAGDDDDVVGWG